MYLDEIQSTKSKKRNILCRNWRYAHDHLMDLNTSGKGTLPNAPLHTRVTDTATTPTFRYDTLDSCSMLLSERKKKKV